MIFERFYDALIGYIYLYVSIYWYVYVYVYICAWVQNIDDRSRTKSVKMRQRRITTIWGGWRKNEGSGTHAHIRSEDEQSAVLFFLEIVPNQPEKEATTRRNLFHSFFFLFSISFSSRFLPLSSFLRVVSIICWIGSTQQRVEGWWWWRRRRRCRRRWQQDEPVAVMMMMMQRESLAIQEQSHVDLQMRVYILPRSVW
jgi:hypothetical protein